MGAGRLEGRTVRGPDCAPIPTRAGAGPRFAWASGHRNEEELMEGKESRWQGISSGRAPEARGPEAGRRWEQTRPPRTKAPPDRGGHSHLPQGQLTILKLDT